MVLSNHDYAAMATLGIVDVDSHRMDRYEHVLEGRGREPQ